MAQSGDWWGNVFKGEYHYTLDEKGRLVLPTKFRRALGAAVVVTRGLDECIWIYSPREWTQLEKKLRGLAISNRNLVRFILAGAEDVELDGQGRMMLPAHLRTYAKVEHEAVIVGVSNRIEIWGKERWQSVLGRLQGDTTRLADDMKDLSF